MTNVINLDLFNNMMKYVSLDSVEELPYIEVIYRCGNCGGAMSKRFVAEESNLKDNGIVGYLTSDINVRHKSKLPVKCIYCKLRKFCYHCPARAYLETGSEEAPALYFCELAKMAKKRIKEFKKQPQVNLVNLK